MLRGTTALIQLEKGRRCHEERDAVAAHEFADGGDVERGGMKDHARVVEHDEPEDEIAERMEERKNAKNSLVLVEMEDLAGSLRIGVDTEVRQHHAFRFPRAAAAEDDGDQVVHCQRAVLSAGPFDQPRRGAEGEETCDEFLSCADGAGDVLQPNNRRPVG